MASAPVTTPPPPRWARRRRRSFAGPIVLIAIGILFLLGNMHVLAWHGLGLWFAHFWPLLLILWGVIKLIEYYAAQQGGYAAPGLGVGSVLLLIFLIVLGISATAASRFNWGEVDWGNDNESAAWFGNSYNYNDTLEQPFTPGDTLHLTANHGDINITAWEQDKIRVVVNKKVVADSQADADKINQQSKPALNSEGHITTLTSESGIMSHSMWFTAPAVHTDLDIYLPRKATVDLNADHGDLKLTGRDGDVQITHNHGDVDVEDSGGNLNATVNHGDVTARRIGGDVRLEGRIGDADISDINGSLTITGDYISDVSLSRVAKGVRFDSSRTNLQLGSLAGEMKLDGSDLRVENSAGGCDVHTRSKEIHLENVAGNVGIQDSNGEIELHGGAKLGDVSIANRNGTIQLYLPPAQAFTLEASTRDGNIESDFGGINISNQSRSASASGTVGVNGRRIQLTNEHADIEIRKGLTVTETQSGDEEEPAAPAAPNGHPKAPKATSTSEI